MNDDIDDTNDDLVMMNTKMLTLSGPAHFHFSLASCGIHGFISGSASLFSIGNKQYTRCKSMYGICALLVQELQM
jgi:dihydrodipicolinate synthase/N-acetylneuraminate lyase